MRINAYRSLWISLLAVLALLILGQSGVLAAHHRKSVHTSTYHRRTIHKHVSHRVIIRRRSTRKVIVVRHSVRRIVRKHHKSHVVVKKISMALPKDTPSRGGNLVRTAYAFRGARYRTGGVSAGGFDCSGFVKYLYAKQGVDLPHSSRAQYNYGKHVAKTDLKPGDLLFFSGTYRHGISHVGIYIGDGKFIHASTHSTGVRVDELNSAYYRRRYTGARRP